MATGNGSNGGRLRIADLQLDLDQRRLLVNGDVLTLSKLNFRLLRELARAAPALMTKEELAEKVWDGRFVTPETVAQRVKLLRQALNDDARSPRYIEVVRGQGYRLLPDVSTVPMPNRNPSTFLGNREAAAGLILGETSQPSVAVLPFDTLGDDNLEHTIFADGLSHDLITCLGRSHWLFIAGRGSSFMFRGSGHSASDVGAKLGVRYVVQGCVVFSGSRIRVNAALTDAASGKQIWAEVLQGELGDVFAIQDEIVNAIVESVEVEVDKAEQSRAALRQPESLDSWTAYHRGWWHLNRFEADSLENGELFFRRSLELDPDSARAYAGLSCVYWIAAFLEVSGDRDADVELALEHANTSVALDPSDPLAHWALGRALHIAVQLDQALQEFEISNELNPNFAFGKFAQAFAMMLAGDNESSNDIIDKARRLSPFDPMSYAMLGVKATNLALLGEYEQAAKLAVRGSRLQAWKCQMFPVIAAVCNTLAGRDETAREYYAKLLDERPGYDAADYFRAFPHQPASNVGLINSSFESLRRLN